MYERIIITIVAVIGLPLLTYGIGKLAAFLDAKIGEIQNKELADMVRKAVDVVEQSVLFVMQTYVDALKATGNFDHDAQKEAFEKARKRVYELLDDKTKNAISSSYGSFALWLQTRIEQTVRETKKEG